MPDSITGFVAPETTKGAGPWKPTPRNVVVSSIWNDSGGIAEAQVAQIARLEHRVARLQQLAAGANARLIAARIAWRAAA